MPVSRLAREATHTGVFAAALQKFTLCAAKRSRCGVCAWALPE